MLKKQLGVAMQMCTPFANVWSIACLSNPPITRPTCMPQARAKGRATCERPRAPGPATGKGLYPGGLRPTTSGIQIHSRFTIASLVMITTTTTTTTVRVVIISNRDIHLSVKKSMAKKPSTPQQGSSDNCRNCRPSEQGTWQQIKRRCRKIKEHNKIDGK